MIRRFVKWYLKKMLKFNKHQEISIEMNADLIKNPDPLWQDARQNSNALKRVILLLEVE